jgi:hypothetical protein
LGTPRLDSSGRQIRPASIDSFGRSGGAHPTCVEGLGTLASPGTCIALRVPAQRNFSLQDCVVLSRADYWRVQAPQLAGCGRAGGDDHGQQTARDSTQPLVRITRSRARHYVAGLNHDQLAAGIRGAEWVVLENSAHFAPVEEPDRYRMLFMLSSPGWNRRPPDLVEGGWPDDQRPIR